MLAFCFKSSTRIYFLNKIISEKEAIHFEGLNVIADREMSPADREMSSLKFSMNDSLELLKMDSIFKPKDISFIREQINSQNDFRFKQGFIKGKQIISSDLLNEFGGLTEKSFWTKLKERYGTDEFGTFSKPLFSIDGSAAVVRINYYTKNGGGGETMVFHKTGDKWKVVKMLGFWDN